MNESSVEHVDAENYCNANEKMTSISNLNSFCQKRHIPPPQYIIDTIGNNFGCTVTVELPPVDFLVGGELRVKSECHYTSKRAAKEAAAEQLLKCIPISELNGVLATQLGQSSTPQVDPVSQLNVYSQKSKVPAPVYNIIEKSQGSVPTFSCKVTIMMNGEEQIIDLSSENIYLRSKKEAKAACAARAVDAIRATVPGVDTILPPISAVSNQINNRSEGSPLLIFEDDSTSFFQNQVSSSSSSSRILSLLEFESLTNDCVAAKRKAIEILEEGEEREESVKTLNTTEPVQSQRTSLYEESLQSMDFEQVLLTWARGHIEVEPEFILTSEESDPIFSVTCKIKLNYSTYSFRSDPTTTTLEEAKRNSAFKAIMFIDQQYSKGPTPPVSSNIVV